MNCSALVNRSPSIELLHIDCMDYMATLEDNAFQLAIVDPPYGIGIDGQKLDNNNKKPKHNRKAHYFKGWDSGIPTAEYFSELKRVSTNQIIWGGNYFTEHLPPVKAWIFWYKGQRDLSMSDGEMAWTSFDKVTRQIELNRVFISRHGWSIHPTQKPVKLYEWLLKNYAKPGDRILDTHLGSASLAIAAHYAGHDFVGCELDEDYYNAAVQRFNDETKQQALFK